METSMRSIVLVTITLILSGVCLVHAQAQDVSPLDIQFRRQAVHRLVFDRESAIPLSMVKPDQTMICA